MTLADAEGLVEMTRGIVSPKELAFAAGLLALAGFAALALGHGRYQVAVLVEIAMAAGFVSVVRTRDGEAKGQRLPPRQAWSAVAWFVLAVLGLLLAPSL